MEGAGPLCVCEGYATGASIHEATGYPVAVAFNAGNLLPVARALRAKFPDLRLIVCADDDAETPGNPGLTKARVAARTVSGLVAVPDFGVNRPEGLKDFNDLALHRGLEAVRASIEAAEIPGPPDAAAWDGERASAGDEANSASPGANCESRVILVRGDALRVEPIRQLWDGWLTRGKLHMLAGAPGTGKSTIALTLAAVVTAGGRWPDGTKCTPGHVLAWSGEDDPADTLLPRLLVAGGDPKRFHIVTGTVDRDGARQFDPATDIPALLAVARENPEWALVLVDLEFPPFRGRFTAWDSSRALRWLRVQC